MHGKIVFQAKVNIGEITVSEISGWGNTFWKITLWKALWKLVFGK